MNIIVIIIFVILIVSWAIIKGKQEKNIETKSIDNEIIIDEIIEMEKVFLEEINKGEKAYKIMTIFNQFDLMFIKSLFQSEQIPYFVEFEHSSRMRPGMQISYLGYSNIYILEKDYNDTIKVIEEYKKNKDKDYIEKDTIRKPLEVFFGTWTVPEANEINGMDIYYKK
jgi:hypothetical protein